MFRSGERVYYRPAGPTTIELSALAIVAALVLFLIEARPWSEGHKNGELAVSTAKETARAFAAVRKERERRQIPLLPELDPAQSGLIFRPATSITTSSGVLSAKQTSINPNFAALFLAFYLELGLKRGDAIAIGVTGSFPAWNIAALIAAEKLGLEPLVIASAAASDYGASDEAFSWLDIATFLKDAGILQTRTLAASLGGLEDLGTGLSPAGAKVLEEAIAKSGAERLHSTSYDESLTERLAIYDRAREGRPIRAYVNIGGGAVSFGRSRATGQFSIGINQPREDVSTESVMGVFLSRGVPVIQLVQVVELARRYGLPVRPKTMPIPGAGAVFRPPAPDPKLPLAGILALTLGITFVGLRARRRRERSLQEYNPISDSAPSRHARPPSRAPTTPQSSSTEDGPDSL